MSFLFKEMSEEDRLVVEADARRIIESFGSKLEGIGELGEMAQLDLGDGFREEGKDAFCDVGFKERILLNAKNKNDDFILAEKKKW